MAQLGAPDMTLPIQYALRAAPERVDAPARRLNLSLAMHFADLWRAGSANLLPALPTVSKRQSAAGCISCLLNGANEEAVALFLQDKIEYLQLFDLVRETLEHFAASDYRTVEEVLEADAEAREVCTQPRRTKTVWMCKVKFPGEY